MRRAPRARRTSARTPKERKVDTPTTRVNEERRPYPISARLSGAALPTKIARIAIAPSASARRDSPIARRIAYRAVQYSSAQVQASYLNVGKRAPVHIPQSSPRSRLIIKVTHGLLYSRLVKPLGSPNKRYGHASDGNASCDARPGILFAYLRSFADLPSRFPCSVNFSIHLFRTIRHHG